MVKAKSKGKQKKRSFTGSVRKDAEKRKKGSQYGYLNLPKGLPIFKEDPGSRVSLDILPYEVTVQNHPDRNDEYGNAVPGGLWYKRPYWLHRNIGSENQAVVCPSSVNGKCPICEYRAQLLKDGADWNDDTVRALKPSMRNLYVVVPKNNKKYEEVPHVWDISQFLFQDKLEEEFQENEEYDSFPDLEEGYTLQIRFSEENFGSNKFADTSRIDFKNRAKPYDESILEEVPNLDELLEILSYKAIEALFYGGVGLEEQEEDEEEEETKPKRKTASSKRHSQEDEDEDPDEDDEDEDSDEDEDDEDDVDDDEDDDDDDGEEEETPPRRTKKPADKPVVKKQDKKAEKIDKKSRDKKKTKCPHGYEFGKDNDEYDECDDCECWDACLDYNTPF